MDKLAVYIQEEYGYRDWLWIPNMTVDEVKSWWKELPSVSPYFFTGPISFPGQVHQIAFRNEKEFQFVEEGDGRVVYPMHEDYITMPDDCVRIHIHEDFDSYLSVGDETIYHAGYVPFDEVIDKDI